MSEEINFISDDQAKSLTEVAKTVKDNAYLSLSVYPMQVDSIESKKDKNEVPYLRINVNSGYETKDGRPRMLNQIFYLEGYYLDGKPKIEELARFMKRCFKISNINNATLKSIIKKKLAVATRKDQDGYIQFWYAEHIDGLETAKANYKIKKEEPRFTSAKAVGEAVPKDLMQPAEEPEPDFLKGIEVEQTEEGNEIDDLPFN